MPRLKPARIVSLYAIVSVLWILFSDNAAAFLFSASPSALLWANTLKGWSYVAVISVLLWALLKRFETQSARQSQDLLESEAKYRSVVENISDVYYRTDASGNLVMVSPSVEKLLGYPTSEELLGRAVASFWERPEGRTVFLDTLREHGEVHDFEVTLLRGDGSPIVVSTSSKLYHDPAGAVAGVEGIFRDITERKTAEDTLKTTHKLTNSILDSMPTSIIALDGDGRITHFNLSAQALCRTTTAQALGAALPQVLPHFPFTTEELEAARRERATLRLERKAFPSREGPRLMDILVYPLDCEDAKRTVIIIADITERARIEDMMVQTEKMMSVGGLAAGMAHEINNPLSGILQSIQVVINRLTADSPGTLAAAEETGCNLEAMRNFLRTRGILGLIEGVREAAGRAAHIVADMLEFSRKSESTQAPTDINALLDKAVELCASDYNLKKRYDFRHVHIERDYAQDLPRVPCSVTQIQQVVMNLLRNAAQSMADRPADAPPPAITLRTRRDKGMVRIDVEDNGAGMDEATRRKIFEPFFTTKPVGEGTGLGLSVSYFIITSTHKGTLEVDSTPGKGTRFGISLPIGED